MPQSRREFIARSFLATTSLLGGCASIGTGTKFDTVIKGGLIVDGTGLPALRADVGILGDRIVALEPSLPTSEARTIIDASSLVVAPGFIEPHAHISDIAAFPAPENFLRQGITTLVNSLHSLDQPYPLGEYVGALETAQNTVWTAGHTWLRKYVIGLDNRDPSFAELRRMEGLVAEAMDAGAIGLGTGLEYIPANYAKQSEVIALARAAQRPNALYVTHMRDEGRALPEALEEAIDVGREAGLPVHISHLKSTGVANAGMAQRVLARIDEANRQGVKVSFDVYPYDAYSTYSTVLFPSWVLAGGTQAFRDRVGDPTTQARLKTEMPEIFRSQTLGSLEDVVFRSIGEDMSFAGRTLADWLRMEGRPPTLEAGFDALIELETEGGFIGIFRAMAETDIDAFLTHSRASVSSDGDLVEFGKGFPHPRSYGSYPRVLGRYVRERGLLTLEQAVAKMTSRPADDLRIRDRGRIRTGAFADIVVFDQERITDHATFDRPHQFSKGIVHLLVNGAAVMSEGSLTGRLPGRVLRRADLT
jgi:N-acyl-D-amino-acid deacylase